MKGGWLRRERSESVDVCFFFQAEDGIRDYKVTGVQTCALPIYQDFARGVNLPGVILHGLLKAGYLGQLLTDWIGDRGTLKSFEVSYRGIDVPDKPYRCRGRITKVDGKDVELEVWGEDENGQKTTLGSATVQLS